MSKTKDKTKPDAKTVTCGMCCEVRFGQSRWTHEMMVSVADYIWVDKKFYPPKVRDILKKFEKIPIVVECDLLKELPQNKSLGGYEDVVTFFEHMVRIRRLPSSHRMLEANPGEVDLLKAKRTFDDELDVFQRSELVRYIADQIVKVIDKKSIGYVEYLVHKHYQTVLETFEFEDSVFIHKAVVDKLLSEVEELTRERPDVLYGPDITEYEIAAILKREKEGGGVVNISGERWTMITKYLMSAKEVVSKVLSLSSCLNDYEYSIFSPWRPTKITAEYAPVLRCMKPTRCTSCFYFTADVRHYFDLLHKNFRTGKKVNRVKFPVDCLGDTIYYHFINHAEFQKAFEYEFGPREEDVLKARVEIYEADDITVPFPSPQKWLVFPVTEAFRKLLRFLLFDLQVFTKLKESSKHVFDDYFESLNKLLQPTKTDKFCVEWSDVKSYLENAMKVFTPHLEDNDAHFFQPNMDYNVKSALKIMHQAVKPFLLPFYHDILKNDDFWNPGMGAKCNGTILNKKLEETVAASLGAQNVHIALFFHNALRCHFIEGCYLSFFPDSPIELPPVCFVPEETEDAEEKEEEEEEDDVAAKQNYIFESLAKYLTLATGSAEWMDKFRTFARNFQQKVDERMASAKKKPSKADEKMKILLKEMAELKSLKEELEAQKKEHEELKIKKTELEKELKKEKKVVVKQAPVPIPAVDLSTFFAYEITEKVETTRRCAKVVEKEKETKKLWNGHMVLKTLKHLLPEKIYKRLSVMLTPKFHGQLAQKYYTYQDILHMIQKFEWNNYHNYDKLLDDFQQLRSIPGSAMFFDLVGVLDYFIDEEKDEKAYDLKQNWLKRFAIKNAIQRKWNKDVLDIIIGHELDKVARGLGCCEAVKIEDYQKKFEEINKILMEQNEEEKKEQEKWIKSNKGQFNKMKDDKKLIEALIGFALNSEEYHTSHWLRNIIQHELETNDDRNDVIDHVLCDIYTARRTVAKLCELDEYGLTTKWKKEEMKDIPMVRCIKLKEKIVFTSEVRYALEVAEQLNKFNMDMADESLKMHGLTDNRVEVFDYVSVVELDDIATTNGLHQLPFELVHFEHPKLKTSHSYAPIISPNYTMCIPAFVVLEQVFNILSNELKIFYRLRRDSINELTRYIANLCYYLQPESQTTFCLDYKKVGELLDETRRLFNPLMDSSVEDMEDVDESIKPKEFKKILEKLTKNSVFRSFEIMLMAFADKAEQSHTNLSRNSLDDCVYNAGCRCLMYEYPEVAIAYHNQKMCQTNNKTQFCSICLIEDVEFRFDTPSRCAVGYSQSMAEFQKKNDSGRMEKVVLEESWIERMNKKVDMEMEEEKKKKLEEEEAKKVEEVEQVELCPIDENVVFERLIHEDVSDHVWRKKKSSKAKKHNDPNTVQLFMSTNVKQRTKTVTKQEDRKINQLLGNGDAPEEDEDDSYSDEEEESVNYVKEDVTGLCEKLLANIDVLLMNMSTEPIGFREFSEVVRMVLIDEVSSYDVTLIDQIGSMDDDEMLKVFAGEMQSKLDVMVDCGRRMVMKKNDFPALNNEEEADELSDGEGPSTRVSQSRAWGRRKSHRSSTIVEELPMIAVKEAKLPEVFQPEKKETSEVEDLKKEVQRLKDINWMLTKERLEAELKLNKMQQKCEQEQLEHTVTRSELEELKSRYGEATNDIEFQTPFEFYRYVLDYSAVLREDAYNDLKIIPMSSKKLVKLAEEDWIKYESEMTNLVLKAGVLMRSYEANPICFDHCTDELKLPKPFRNEIVKIMQAIEGLPN